jgi:RimJ/RimL family protein N-acetyltransferase
MVASEPREFVAIRDPASGVVAEMTALDRANPFVTPAYAPAKRQLGTRLWHFGLRNGSHFRRKLRTGIRLLRTQPTLLASRAFGTTEFYVVYCADPKTVPTPSPNDKLELQKLSDSELAALPLELAEFREQMDRFRLLGYNDAFAVIYDGCVAHISWLVTSAHDRRNSIRNVKLRHGEAEITHCMTLPEYRGRGLYPFAIRSLCQIAQKQGIRRVFMITGSQNSASQRGIEKAGLVRSGWVARWVFPFIPNCYSPVLRSHRWPDRLWRSKTS